VAKAKLRPLWLIPPGLASLAVILGHARSQTLLQDSDTKVLLEVIRETQNPWAWFVGDWPLENHFYRPISTLFFEFDNWAHGTNAAGYGLTNAVIAALCIMALVWLVRELMEDWALAGISGTVFGLWHLGVILDSQAVSLVMTAGALACLVGFFRGKQAGALAGVAATVLAAYWIGTEYGPVQDISFRIVGWLPGRTASVMTLFALIAGASYARWERLGAARIEPKVATSTEKPFRASDPVNAAKPTKGLWVWPIIAVLGTALALGSYEQAVMLPGLLIGSSILMAIRGWKPRWWIHAGTWSLLAGYLVLRAVIIPKEVSGYQSQQLRTGFEGGVLMDLLNYLAPGLNWIRTIIGNFIPDPLIVLTAGFWAPIISLIGCFAAIYICAKDDQRWSILGFWLMAFFAFLPMAWLKMFEHYHYWPSAFLSVAWVLIVGAAIRAVVSAVSPQAIQAPKRSDPAPGSLPHP
jgi:hypothetical protein